MHEIKNKDNNFAFELHDIEEVSSPFSNSLIPLSCSRCSSLEVVYIALNSHVCKNCGSYIEDLSY